MKKRPHNDDQVVRDESQPVVRPQKKPFNTQVLEQQHHHRQPHQIQARISSAKKKVSSRIQGIAKSISGVWTVVHRIWALLLINSPVHRVWYSTNSPIHAITRVMFSAKNQKQQHKGKLLFTWFTFFLDTQR